MAERETPYQANQPVELTGLLVVPRFTSPHRHQTHQPLPRRLRQILVDLGLARKQPPERTYEVVDVPL